MWRIQWAPNSIPVYIQQDATLHILFISGNCATCFGWYFHPSSGAHTTVSTESGICHTVTATCRYRGRVGNRFECAVDGVLTMHGPINVKSSNNISKCQMEFNLAFKGIKHVAVTSGICLFLARQPPHWSRVFSFTRFLDHTKRHTTVGRTPLDKWSARRKEPVL